MINKFREDLLRFGEHLILFAICIVAGYFLGRLLLGLIRKLLNKSKLDKTAQTFIISCLKVLVYGAVVLASLEIVGISVNSVITALGAIGLTAGLALQDTLKNLVGGMILLSNKPFSAGDLIEADGFEGYVDSVQIFFTTIHTFENKIVKIPNSILTSKSVVNCTMGELRRATLSYTVSYEDNLTKVKSVIYDVISKNELIVDEPAPQVLVGNHLDSGIEIKVWVWANEADYYNVYYYMQENVKLAFDANHITIPYPHIVVKN